MTCNTCKANKVCDHNKYGFENCNNYISADVVEVVRCRDCSEWDKDECECSHWYGFHENDYCSFAERKDT